MAPGLASLLRELEEALGIAEGRGAAPRGAEERLAEARDKARALRRELTALKVLSRVGVF